MGRRWAVGHQLALLLLLLLLVLLVLLVAICTGGWLPACLPGSHWLAALAGLERDAARAAAAGRVRRAACGWIEQAGRWLGERCAPCGVRRLAKRMGGQCCRAGGAMGCA